MSATEETAQVVVPDGIEPVEAWRVWNIEHGVLKSLNGTPWVPGEALRSDCHHADQYRWRIVRRAGIKLEDARIQAETHNSWAAQANLYSMSSRNPTRTPYIPIPHVELPDWHGYVLDTECHTAPHEDCTCGIYAGTSPNVCPAGMVVGKVKLWGKIVPGEQGYRAEFAYPSEFHISPDQVGTPVLEEFGVPLVLLQNPVPQTLRHLANASTTKRALSFLWVAATLNLLSATYNLLQLAHVF